MNWNSERYTEEYNKVLISIIKWFKVMKKNIKRKV